MNSTSPPGRPRDAARRVERYQTDMLIAKLRHAAALLSEINDEYEGLRFNWNPTA